MVAGEEGVVFADLFAADGVLRYPFAVPGLQPDELRGRETIRAFFAGMASARDSFAQDGVDAAVWETDDPEVVVTEITHGGRVTATGAPYRLTALGIIRVHDGEITQYDDYMNPVAIAQVMGRTGELAAALGVTG
jgi:hypothetical protein